MDPELLRSLKALSDATRLRIVGLLAGGKALSVEALSSALDLPAGSVAHHVKRLREAGLVEGHHRPGTIEYELLLGRLATIGAELGHLDRDAEAAAPDPLGPEGRPLAPFDAKVLRSFLVGGRLTGIPAQGRKRLVVLRYLATNTFEPDRDYPEKEVNQALALLHPDVASLRRYLVDEGFMEREAGIYRLRPRAEWPAEPAASPVV